MQDAVIVAAARTAVGKAPKGTLKTVRPDEMAAAVIGDVLRRAPGIDANEVDDVILGCAMPEAEQGMNVARIASLRAGIPVTASAATINRFDRVVDNVDDDAADLLGIGRDLGQRAGEARPDFHVTEQSAIER